MGSPKTISLSGASSDFKTLDGSAAFATKELYKGGTKPVFSAKLLSSDAWDVFKKDSEWVIEIRRAK